MGAPESSDAAQRAIGLALARQVLPQRIRFEAPLANQTLWYFRRHILRFTLTQTHSQYRRPLSPIAERVVQALTGSQQKNR
jgi:hypothetical protein